MDMHFDGVIFKTHAAELARRIERPHPPYYLIDVRPAAEWAAGRVPGAVPLAPAALADGLPAGTTPTTEFVVIGADPDDPGLRQATLALRRHGATRCVELTGGMLEWRQLGLPLEAGESAAA